MKKSILFFALFAVFMMSSCGEDEDPILTVNKKLEGKWNVTSYIEDEEQIINVDVSSILMEYFRDSENIATGTTEWLISEDSYSETINMDYIISDMGETITFSLDNKEFKIDISDNTLDLEGVDSDMIQITAIR